MPDHHEAQPIKVIIIDSNPLVREGLRNSLLKDPQIDLAAEAADGMAGLYAADRNRGAILMVNAVLSDMSFLSVISKYRAMARGEGAVVVYQVPEDPALLMHIVENQGSALVGMNAAAEEYAVAVRAASASGIYLSPNLFSCLMAERKAARGLSAAYDLTTREGEVLQLLANGLSNKEVACKLDLSVRTVEAHRFSIRQKTGANTLSDLVRIARGVTLSQQQNGSAISFSSERTDAVFAIGGNARQGDY
ncbi:hypothetical protein CSC94_14440 [Zhengella mangrovi]|uniref:DNA-binding response regulator n=1 Tax=Zhengella mangrovi TaxID=1982044 RepID=A0A2G1QLS1_9HYPH|nr:response regulator transcription factor [Zhengella mangrovi]PHP66473.1 hypothetical protein CSC94_14440 [Zhengella mangrovi]